MAFKDEYIQSIQMLALIGQATFLLYLASLAQTTYEEYFSGFYEVLQLYNVQRCFLSENVHPKKIGYKDYMQYSLSYRPIPWSLDVSNV